MNGKIFNIQRFSINDGPGIRTTVFMKGCPLSCVWCHNPESQNTFPEMFFDSEKCINCGKCKAVCGQNRHIFDSGKHVFLRDNCALCMKCIVNCPVGIIELCGKDMSSDEAVAEVLRDKEFYEQSGGGITLSGGEPLLQYDFSLEILQKAKQSGIHTAVETSGYCNKELSEICQYVDLWLYDIKVFSEREHVKYTGVSNKKISENLHYLNELGANIVLRCPIIPEINFNENHFGKIADLANKLRNIAEIDLEPYHPMGIDKAKRLGKTQKYKNQCFLSKDDILPLADFLKSKTDTIVKII